MDIPPPTPPGGISPYLTPSDANAAADFYKKAFGAEELARMPAQDGKRLMHCQLRVNGALLMLSDGFPEHGHPALPPQAVVLHLQVDDIDVWWKRAVDAGAAVSMPVELMFWGDRYGVLKDPFGFSWSLGQTPTA
jgi:PhnB protein